MDNISKEAPPNITVRTRIETLCRERGKKSEGVIEANEEDLERGLKIFEWLYPSRNTSLTHSQKKLVDYLKETKVSKSGAELFRELGHYHYTQIGKMLRGLRSLAAKGFINISEGEKMGRPVDLYEYIEELDHNELLVSKVSKVSKVIRVSKVSPIDSNSLSSSEDDNKIDEDLAYD